MIIYVTSSPYSHQHQPLISCLKKEEAQWHTRHDRINIIGSDQNLKKVNFLHFLSFFRQDFTFYHSLAHISECTVIAES